MSRKAFLSRSVLCFSVVFLTAFAVQGSKAQASEAYGEVIAGPGQSEVIVENTLPVPVKIFINGQLAGTAKGRGAERLVVSDGGHHIKVQSTERNGAMSRDVQFNTQSRRFVFKVTSPNITTVSLTRENAYPITPARPAATAAAPAAARPAQAAVPAATPPPPPPQTALQRDKANMFDRMDNQLAKREQAAPAPAPAAAPSAAPAPVAAAPAAAAAPAPAARVDPVAAPVAPPPGKSGVATPIAVYVTGERPEGEKKILATKFTAALTNSGRFIAVERGDEFLDKIDEEHIKQRSETVDEKHIRELGKQFGAGYICAVNIVKAFGGFQVSARVIDVETALVVMIGEDSGPLNSMEDADIMVFKVVRALLK